MAHFYRFIFLTSVLVLACACSSRAAAWTHEAYVWQRQPAPAALDAALENTHSCIDAYCFLAAEVAFDKTTGAPKITRIPLDYAKLAAFSNAAASRKPIALAIRVGTLTTKKQFADFQPRLIALATELLATTRAAKLDPAELQLDFDCPESKLDLYRDWLAALRPALGKTPLAITALPVWLQHEDAFIALAHDADSFILQVHSLQKPYSMSYSFTLCDSGSALRYADSANNLAVRAGARFRIALPTYGYTVGFDAEGRFIGIAAETPRDWPAGTQLRTVRSDPRAMQTLAQELAAKHFSNATGIIWFRLPLEGDRLVWPAGTFAAVIQNKPIAARLAAEVHRTQPGLAEIVIINQGQTVEPLPDTLRVTWTRGTSLVSYDGLAGYCIPWESADSNTRTIKKDDLVANELAPGRARVVGWLRFDFPDSETAEKFSIHASIP